LQDEIDGSGRAPNCELCPVIVEGGFAVMSLRWRVAGVIGLALLPVSWNGVPFLPAPTYAQQTYPGVPPRTYSKKPDLRLPIHIDDRVRSNLNGLQLWVKAPGADWAMVQAGPANQESFDYRAPKDGEYSFMFVAIDKNGHSIPSSLDSRPPHQFIIVDTMKPELGIQKHPVSTDTHLECVMRDANPDFASIKLEFLGEDKLWHPLDLVQPDHHGIFRVPHDKVLQGKVRASAKDKAGNSAERIFDLSDPLQSFGLPPKPAVAENHSRAADKGAAQAGFNEQKKTDALELKVPEIVVQPDPKPANDADARDRDAKKAANAETSATPPKALEVVAPDELKIVVPDAVPQVVVPDAKGADSYKQPEALPKTVESKKITTTTDNKPVPFDPFLPDMKIPTEKPAMPVKNDIPKPRVDEALRSELAQPDARQGSTHRIINTAHCTLNYAVENYVVGGQPKIEFWVTRDAGQSWSRINDESGGSSPARLTLPGDGMYGIRVKANGNGAPPRPGEAPDGWVEVDTAAPTVRMQTPVLGTGAKVGTLMIQWSAADKNLIPESINILHASRPDGPWQTVASNVANDGNYQWIIPPGIGSEIYLRVEATDRAGNVGRAELREPFSMPQPKIKLLSIDRAP